MNSKIILAKGIHIDKDYTNVLSYSESNMLALVNSKKIAERNDCSFLRNTNSIFVEIPYDTCLQSNYIAFQNPDYSNKWFFAWVDNVVYKSNKSVEIQYTIDAWSTWFSYWQRKSCYVLREHTNDDRIGVNTVDEGLAVQEVMANEDATYDSSLDSDYFVAITSNWNADEETGYHGICAYNKAVFGQKVILFDLTEDGLDNLEKYIFIVNGQGHIEDLHDMFIIPEKLVPSGNYTVKTIIKERIAGVTVATTIKELRYDTQQAFRPITKGYFIEKLRNYTDITIKNNKCYCYPYNYLFVSNSVGSNNIYKYEDFEDNEDLTCDFQLQMALSIGVSGRVVPLAHKGLLENVDESLELAKFPTCSWSSDSYINWLTSQAVNIAGSVVQGVASVATGNFLGATAQVASLLGQFYQAQLLPNKTGGTATGDVNFAAKNCSFRFMRMRAKPEYMAQIDDYFSRYGYKTIRTKLPNITGRANWNYIEIGSSEEIGYGDVPSQYMSIINGACRKGVTIWHNHDNLGNYALDNSIV